MTATDGSGLNPCPRPYGPSSRITTGFLLFLVELGASQSGINNRAQVHRHALCTEVCFDGLKDLLAQIVLLQQMPEGQDRGLIRNPIADQIDAGKPAHGWHLDQGLFHRWIAERIPLL